MRFPDPLIPGRLVRRYKRFLADVTLDSGDLVTAHCANPGAMTGLNLPDTEVWLSPSRNPARKLAYSWELARVGDGLVGINTAHPNGLVEEAIRDGRIAEVRGYESLRREVKYGKNSRVDMLLSDDAKPDCYVEVKNVHLMRQPGLAEFPDAVTKRGTKHLNELADMVAAGHRAMMVYLVQREDCQQFTIAADVDPDYAAAFKASTGRGVEAICYRCSLTTDGIDVADALPIVI
jgi:sugar fermentation stimulation protein A